MKLLSIILIIFVFTGCATLRSAEIASGKHQDQVVSKEVIVPGKVVNIVTTDGKHQKFKVVEVTDDYIAGKNIRVPTTNIVSIRSEKFSAVKTVLKFAGSFVLISVLIFAVAHA